MVIMSRHLADRKGPDQPPHSITLFLAVEIVKLAQLLDLKLFDHQDVQHTSIMALNARADLIGRPTRKNGTIGRYHIMITDVPPAATLVPLADDRDNLPVPYLQIPTGRNRRTVKNGLRDRIARFALYHFVTLSEGARRQAAPDYAVFVDVINPVKI